MATDTEYLANIKQQVDYTNENEMAGLFVPPPVSKNHLKPFYVQNVKAHQPRSTTEVQPPKIYTVLALGYILALFIFLTLFSS